MKKNEPSPTTEERRAIRVSFVLAVRHESRLLPEVLERLLAAPLPEGCEKEIVLVVEGPAEKSSDLVQQHREHPQIVVHRFPGDFGKGAAIRVGIAKATGDIVLIQEGDLGYVPEKCSALLEPILSGRAMAVYGSRLLSSFRGLKWTEWLLTKILTSISNFLFHADITDVCGPWKAFRKEVLQAIKLGCTRDEFCAEVTAKLRRLGCRISEVPALCQPGGMAEGVRLSWHDGLRDLVTLLRYRIVPRSCWVAPTALALARKQTPSFALFVFWLLLPLLLFVHLRSFTNSVLPLRATFQALAEVSELLRGSPDGISLTIRYASQNVAATLLITLVDLAAGLALLRLVLQSWPALPGGLVFGWSLALGTGLASAGLFALGLGGHLNRWSVLLWTLGMAAFAVFVLPWRGARPFIRKLLRRPRLYTRRRYAAIFLGLLLLPTVIVQVADWMMPVVEFDATMSYMSLAKFYKETGHVAYNHGIRFSAQPHLPVLLFLRHWTLLGDDSLAKLVHLELFSILLAALGSFAAAIGWRGALWPAIAFVSSAPVFLWITKVEYLDFALSSYFALAVATLWYSLRRLNGKVIAAAGLVLGLAGACKYQGLLLAFLATSSFGLILWSRRVKGKQIFKALALLALGVLLFGAPWWVRSYKNTGTPFYPFLSPGIGSADASVLKEVNRALGPERTLRNALAIPVWLATQPPYSYGDPFPIGLAPLLCVTVVVVAAVSLLIRRSPPSPGAAFLALLCGAFFAVWFLAAPVQRHLASLLPVMAMLFLLCLAGLGARRRLPVVLTALLSVLVLQSCLLASTVRRLGMPVPVTYRLKEWVLQNSLDYYAPAQVLNADLRPGERVYLLHAEAARYYVNGESYGDWLGRYRYAWADQGASDLADVLRRLRRAGFHLVLADLQLVSGIVRVAGRPWYKGAQFSDERLGARVLYDDGRWVVLRLE